MSIIQPCPFCGSRAESLDGMGEHWVVCINEWCRSSGPSRTSKEAAIQVWNKRDNRKELQDMAIDAGFKSNAHGIIGTKKQAESLIADLVGVEVEIKIPSTRSRDSKIVDPL